MLGSEPNNSNDCCCNPCAEEKPIFIKPKPVVITKPIAIEADCKVDEKVSSVR